MFSDSQLDILDGQVCRVPRSAVFSVRNLPCTALYRPTSDLGYGLPSLKAYASQLTACHLHLIMNNLGYRGHVAKTHIHTFSTAYTH
jgi:hypothetical protein